MLTIFVNFFGSFFCPLMSTVWNPKEFLFLQIWQELCIYRRAIRASKQSQLEGRIIHL
jgi:hypothetical protein